MTEQTKIKMGEYAVLEGDEVIATMGVGSCVAVCLIDQNHDLAGLAHVMLPEEEGHTSDKHADVLIDKLFDEIEDKEPLTDLEAKVFGGAHMIDDSQNVGEENVESVREILDRKNIDIVAEDTGGEKGRAVWLHTRSGEAVVRKAFGKTRSY